jgi:hypothetical protein
MSALPQTFLLSVSLLLAYIWIQTPILSAYSLQVFALSILLYFVSKKLTKAKSWHITPARESWQMILATFAFSLLIGATGNTNSPFFSLTFVHLFFLVMATHYSTSLVVTAGIVLFHYALAPQLIGSNWPMLATIPVVLIFFLFGKYQNEEVVKGKDQVKNDAQLLTSSREEEQWLLDFISQFLSTKIAQVKELQKFPDSNKEAVMGQLTLIEIEIEKLLQRFRRQNDQ